MTKKTNKNKKFNPKNKIVILIIISTILLGIIIGSTYAYLTLEHSNSSTSTNISNKMGSYGIVNLTTPISSLHININQDDLTYDKKDTSYYATDNVNKNYETTETEYTIAKATVTGGDSSAYYNCKFNLNVNVDGTMASVLKRGDITIEFKGAHKGVVDILDLESPIEVKPKNLTGLTRDKSVKIIVTFKNRDDDQRYLLDKTLTLNISTTNFECINDAPPYPNCDILTEDCDLDTVGDVVKIGNEEFYIIGKEDNKTKLLARYNLNVGIKNTSVTEGIQHSSITGEQPNRYGNVSYGTSSSNYATSTIKTHVDNYISYLNNLGVNVTGRLLYYNEFTSIANAENQFMYSTNYWLHSSGGQYAGAIEKGKYTSYATTTVDNGTYGVRPVILYEP